MFNSGNEVRGSVKMVQQLWCCCAVNIPPECLFTQNENEIEDVFSPEITSKDAFCVKETLRLLDLHEKNELVGKFGPFFHCFIVKKFGKLNHTSGRVPTCLPLSSSCTVKNDLRLVIRRLQLYCMHWFVHGEKMCVACKQASNVCS